MDRLSVQPLIAVVDASPLLRETLVEQLASEGFRVVAWEPSIGIQRLILELRPTVLLIDLVDTSAMELFEAFCEELTVVPTQCIVSISPAQARHLGARLQQTGVFVMYKPFTLDDVRAVLYRALQAAESDDL